MAPAGNPTSGEYPLQRNWAASARLTFQHYVYRDRLGFLIHPDIASALNLHDDGMQKPLLADTEDPVRILDLATGNGVWAVDVASHFADCRRRVEVTSLDVSNAQFPPKEICPQNVNFATHNVFDDVPERYLDKFDIIHVRFLMGALLRPGLKDLMVRNLSKMLKKGGWMQWQELGMPSWGELVFDDVGGATLKLDVRSVSMWEVVDKHVGTVLGNKWLNELATIMSEQGGLVDTKLIRPGVKRELVRMETDIIRWTLEEGKEGLLRMFKTEEGKEEFSRALEEIHGSIESGKLFSVVCLIGVGRKAL